MTTKADGTFVLANDEPRLANLAFLATADGGARQGIFRFQDPTGSKDARTLARIVLKPARVVTVAAVDGRGEPVEGAVVFVLDVVFPVAEGRTDASGIAALRAPADAMTLWIFGYKPGVGFDYFENYRTLPPTGYSPPPERARLVLDSTRTVRIRAVDSAGKPVPGVAIVPDTIFKKGKLRSIQISASPVQARTDERGAATFDWLPADIQAGMSFVVFSASSHLAKPLVLEPGKPDAELTAHVVRFATISGKVTHPDGSPAPGVLVEAKGVGSANPSGLGSGEDHRRRLVHDGTASGAVVHGLRCRRRMGSPELERRRRPRGKGSDWPRFHAGARKRDPGTRHGRPPIAACVGPGDHACRARTGRPAGDAQGPAEGLERCNRPRRRYRHGRSLRLPRRTGRLRAHRAWPRQPGAEPVREQFKVAGGQQIRKDFTLRRVDRPWRTVRGVVRAKAARRAADRRGDHGRRADRGRRPVELKDLRTREAVSSCPARSTSSRSMRAIPVATSPDTRPSAKTTTASHDRGQTGGDGPRPGRRLGGQGPRGRPCRLSEWISTRTKASVAPPVPGKGPKRIKREGSRSPACRSARGAACLRRTPRAATRANTTLL